MEDIRIGRASHNSFSLITTTLATPVTVAPPSKNRIAITFSAGVTGAGSRIVLLPKAYLGSTVYGWVLNLNMNNLTLRVEEIGQAIWQEWVAMAVTTDFPVFTTWTDLPKE